MERSTYILLVGHELLEGAEDDQLHLGVVVAGAVLPDAHQTVPSSVTENVRCYYQRRQGTAR